MARFLSPLSTMVLGFALLSVSAAAFAEAGVPAREGNVWAWRDHQPTQDDVSQKEKAAGVAPTPSQSDSDSVAVDELYQQLIHQPTK